MKNIQKYAKGVAAGAAFVGVVAAQVASGHFDSNALLVSGLAFLGAVGVIVVPNKND